MNSQTTQTALYRVSQDLRAARGEFDKMNPSRTGTKIHLKRQGIVLSTVQRSLITLMNLELDKRQADRYSALLVECMNMLDGLGWKHASIRHKNAPPDHLLSWCSSGIALANCLGKVYSIFGPLPHTGHENKEREFSRTHGAAAVGVLLAVESVIRDHLPQFNGILDHAVQSAMAAIADS